MPTHGSLTHKVRYTSHPEPDVVKILGAQVFERVPVQPRDAREASDVFYKQGTGDALLNYENEVIFTNRAYSGQEAMPYVAPHHNVRARARLRD